MKVDTKETEKSYERLIEVEVPWEEVQKEYNQTFQEFKKNVEMPGFRKGKVPNQVLKRQHGAQIDYQFANDKLEDYFKSALEEIDENPINQASIESLDFSEGEPLQFTARFEVEPEVDVFDYKEGYELDHTVFEATPADVDGSIEEIREQHAEMQEIEDGAEEGHLILADLQRVEPDGTPIIGEKVEDRYIKVGEGVFGEENLEQLKGAKKGDTRRISVPGEGDSETEFYDVNVKKVEEQVLPELDDEFVKELEGESETYDDLREEMQERIQKSLDRESHSQLMHRMAHEFVSKSEVEVPESMVDNYLDMMIKDVKRQRSQNGEEPDIDENVFRENYRGDAIFNLKWQLIKKHIIDEENITVDDEEFEAKIDEMVEQFPEDRREAIKKLYQNEQYRGQIEEELLEDKVIEHLKSFADIHETKKTTTEVRQEAEAQRAAESAIEEMK